MVLCQKMLVLGYLVFSVAMYRILGIIYSREIGYVALMGWICLLFCICCPVTSGK